MPYGNQTIRDIGVADWPNTQPALKEGAIRYASILLNRDEVDLPQTADEDEVETRLVDETKRLITERNADLACDERDLNSVLTQIEMPTDAAEGILKGLLNDVLEEHQHHSRVAKELEKAERQASISLTAEATRHEITRAPKPNKTASITGFAVGFTGVEALVTAASFVGQTGAGGAAAAVGLALSVACTNIGLGGYLAGTVLLPRASRKNSTFIVASIFQMMLAISVAWLVAINVLLGHFRASSGDFQSALAAFVTNPFNVGDMTGLLLIGFGFILSAIWCLKFYGSQDPYLEYGTLGEELRKLRSNLTDNHTSYTVAVRGHAEAAQSKLEEASEDAIAGHRLAREIKSRTDDLINKFSIAQEDVLLKATETAMYRRSVIREMLSPHGRLPSYIAKPIDLGYLRQPRFKQDKQVAFEKLVGEQKSKILTDCARAKEDIERIVAQAFSLPFGASIYPADMLGGHYVEQST